MQRSSNLTRSAVRQYRQTRESRQEEVFPPFELESACSSPRRRLPARGFSGENFSDHAPGDVREPHVAAPLEICQQFVVEAQQVQHRGMQVVHVDFVLDGGKSELIRRPDGLAALDASPRHPNAEASRIVIAARSTLAGRRAAELAAPDDERLVEQAAGFEVLD
jgi:hypothetical protein